MEGSHILLVEDDIALAQWIEDYLLAREFNVTCCHRGDDAVTLIQTLNPDLVLLDGMLPGMDGLDVCKTVRPEFTNPIIMITARDEEIDEVLGLEMGADDYMTKPIRARALLARIRLALRRTVVIEKVEVAPPINEHQLVFNALIINSQSRSVSLNDALVKLSSNEFDVLWLLAKKAGEVVSRESLVTDLRGFDYDGFDRSIDLRVSRLRKKLGDDSTNPYRIKTIWGKGYLFAKDSW
jgi:DNA-binding response OmpR family regulator